MFNGVNAVNTVGTKKGKGGPNTYFNRCYKAKVDFIRRMVRLYSFANIS